LEINRDFAADIFLVIKGVLHERRHASSVISEILSGRKDWSDRKRALFTNTCYDIIRNWRLLWTSLGRDPSFDDRILWHLLGAYQLMKKEELGDRPEYRGMGSGKVKSRLKRSGSVRAIRESIPDILNRTGEEELGEDWDSILHSLNTYSPLSVRANTLKTDRDRLKEILRSEGFDSDPVQWAPHALVLRKKGNIFKLKSFQSGLFEVQDPSSQTVAPFLQVEPGMRVVDACAGQGGKTLHLSALMRNKGQIIAMDDVEWKLGELMKRASRAGANNIRTIHITGSKSYKRMRGSADRVLLDVPCTGLGSMRKNPDLKWTFSVETLNRLRDLQRNILNIYSPLVRSGGSMVYATCSILPSEGEDQVRRFLKNNDGWSMEEERRLRPDRDSFDGFYMARLIRI
jgi:16S rRNA (cytosine967-C5)-methyltransferase